MPGLDVVKSYRANVTIWTYELRNNLRLQGAARFLPPQDGENFFADVTHVSYLERRGSMNSCVKCRIIG